MTKDELGKIVNDCIKDLEAKLPKDEVCIITIILHEHGLSAGSTGHDNTPDLIHDLEEAVNMLKTDPGLTIDYKNGIPPDEEF